MTKKRAERKKDSHGHFLPIGDAVRRNLIRISDEELKIIKQIRREKKEPFKATPTFKKKKEEPIKILQYEIKGRYLRDYYRIKKTAAKLGLTEEDMNKQIIENIKYHAEFIVEERLTHNQVIDTALKLLDIEIDGTLAKMKIIEARKPGR